MFLFGSARVWLCVLFLFVSFTYRQCLKTTRRWRWWVGEKEDRAESRDGQKGAAGAARGCGWVECGEGWCNREGRAAVRRREPAQDERAANCHSWGATAQSMRWSSGWRSCTTGVSYLHSGMDTWCRTLPKGARASDRWNAVWPGVHAR